MSPIFKGLVLLFGIFTVFGRSDAKLCPTDCQCRVYMKSVDCSDNQLQTIPSDVPSWTADLILLGNIITSLDKSSMANITTIKRLDLQNNNLQKINPGTFSGMKSLRNLDLRNNLLQDLEPGTISGLNKLRILKMSNNLLENVDGVVTNLSVLFNLDLSNNRISKLSGASFKKLGQLRYIKLQNNNISEISPNTFSKLRMLSYLDLRNNPLKVVGRILSRNSMLMYLDLTECQLQKIPQKLPNILRVFHIAKNNISEIRKSDLARYKHLQILMLSQNSVEYIENNTFSSLASLAELWLSHNKVDVIPTLSTSVRKLFIDNNRIDCLANDTFLPGSLLEELNVQQNLISDLSDCNFRNIPDLKKLYAGGNSIEKFGVNTFAQLPSLQTLKLEQSDFKIMEADTFRNLHNLTLLSLSRIQTDKKSIKGNIFRPLDRLRTLEVQESPNIADTILASTDMLKSLTKLNELNLMDNSIATLSPDVLKYFPYLSTILLAGNPFHCDQRLLWFKQWLMHEEYKFVNPETLQCKTPSNLRGKQIQDLDKNEFVPTTVPPILVTIRKTRQHSGLPQGKNSSVNVLNGDSFNNVNSTSGNHSNFRDPILDEVIDNPTESDDTNIKYIAIASVAGLLVTGIIFGVLICKLCQRKSAAHQTDNSNNVNYFVAEPGNPPLPLPGRQTRSDRGSVTSQPGEDITNNTESKMKVYTWDN